MRDPGVAGAWPIPRSMPESSRPSNADPKSRVAAVHRMLAETHAPPWILVNRSGKLLDYSISGRPFLEVVSGPGAKSELYRVGTELRRALSPVLMQTKGQSVSLGPIEYLARMDEAPLRVAVNARRLLVGPEPWFLVTFREPMRSVSPDPSSRTDPSSGSGDGGSRTCASLLVQEYEESGTSKEELREANFSLVSDNSRLIETTRRLDQSERELRAILDSVTDAFFSVDEEWRCTYANPISRRTLFAGCEDPCGQVVWDTAPAFRGTEFEKEFRDCRDAGVSRSFQLFSEALDTWTECHCYPVATRLSIMLKDISNEKQQQLSAESKGHQLIQAISRARSGFWSFNLGKPWLDDAMKRPCYFSPHLKDLVGGPDDWGARGLAGWFDLVHPDDLPRLRVAMQRHLDVPGHDFECEYRIRCADGDWRWFQSRGNAVTYPGSRSLRWTALVIDVTDRKRNEEHLGRLAALVESSQDGIVGLSPEGIIQTWNPGARRMYGYDAREAIDRSLWDLLAPAGEDEFLRTSIRQTHEGALLVPLETRLQRKNGRPLDILLTLSPIRDASQRIIGMTSIHSDITRLKRIEALTQELNRVLVAVLRTLPDMVWVLGPSQEIQFLNPAAKEFFGETLPDSILPEDFRRQIRRALETGEDYLPSDFKGVHRIIGQNRDGYFLGRVVTVKDEAGRVLGLTVMLQDVTDFRMLDEIKTSLIGTVSHELKTPITGIRMSILMLEEESSGSLNAKQRRLVQLARKDLDRLLRTLNSLLDLTRFEEGRQKLHLRAVKLPKLIGAAVEEMRSRANDSRLRLSLDVPQPMEHRSLELDYDRMLHVLVNLLQNAIKHSPTHGEIRLRTTQVDSERICISVSDQGPGIPHEYQDRIFERFFKVPGNQKPGTGLGLTIVREFVRAHGGEISVRSDPPHGADFQIVLPCAPK